MSKYLSIALYFVSFLTIQLIVTLVGTALPIHSVDQSTLLVGIQLIGSILTLALFLALRWARLSPNYLRARHWDVFVWAAILTVGTIIPSEFLSELIGAEMPKEMEDILMKMIQSPLGYLTIAIVVPLTEEVVFRGAILRALLNTQTSTLNPQPSTLNPLLAIALSALLFGIAHGNLAQFPHAFILGLLLGWMYYRTRSILPGLIVHFVNNTVAFLLLRLMPGNPDAQLIDLLQGNRLQELLYVGFSLLILLPALYQLHLRMRR